MRSSNKQQRSTPILRSNHDHPFTAMAKNALLGVLESTVGKYVQGLDAKSLNVAVWSGKIELSGLKLDVDAVNDELGRRARAAPNLALPIRVCDGRFDTLKIEVPWARIASRPVVIRASGFEVTVEPHDHLQGVTDLAAKKRKEVRKDEIVCADEDRKRRNALWKINLTDIDGDGNGDESSVAKIQQKSKAEQDAGFTANLIRRIIENLQIEIESFHVSLRGCGAEAGVVLGGLSIATTDEHGTKTFVDRTVIDKNTGTKSKFLFKALSMDGLGLYVDASLPSSLPKAQGHHAYILSPMDFEASVRQSDHEGHTRKMFPKYQVKSKIPQLAASLSRTQLELTNQITAALAPNQNVVRPLFPEYRPTSDILQGGAKDWWRYALRAIGRLNRRRSWAEFFIAYRKRKRYIPLYMRASCQDTHKWIEPLSTSERAIVEAIEQDSSISTEGIMIWRNISDAQVEQEDRAREEAFIREMAMGGPGSLSLDSSGDSPSRGAGGRPSLRNASGRKSSSSIFFSARMELSEEDLMGAVGDGGAPITLTANALREIEEVMFEKEVSDLSSDSKLYDLAFELSEFTVDLIDQGHLASLRMRKAAAGFKANADGSFEFGFGLQSLVVNDRATPNTLFPSIIRSLESSSSPSSQDLVSSSSPTAPRDAFEFRLEKNRLGDQLLRVTMVAFEIVASQDLISGIKNFFTFGSAPKPTQSGPFSERDDPNVTKTPSGDLFYDTAEHHHGDKDDGAGGDHNQHDNIVGMTADAAHAAAAAVSDALATSIVDAWNDKRDEKRAWTIELDLHAPVLVLPQSCASAEATTIIADLGRFIVVFGTNATPPPKVKAWFDERAANDEEKPSVDFCNFTLRDFRCLVGSAGSKDWTKPAPSTAPVVADADDRIVSSDMPCSRTKSKAIIEPLSLSFCIGFESSADKGDDAGTCLIGVLPSISVCASLPQIYDMLLVITTWSTFFGTLGNGGGDDVDIAAEKARSEARNDSKAMAEEPMIDLSQVTKQYLSRTHESRVGDNEKLYVELSLRRISVKLLTHHGDGVEAHLVSIVATSRVLDDGCTSSSMKMGYFWIFDGLEVDFPRAQRLIAHSALPLSAETFADDKYNVMECLEDLGAFDESYDGASDLAEVTVSTSPETLTTSIDGTFSSLFLNFNPLVLRKIVADVTAAPDNGSPEEENGIDLGQSFSQDVIPQGWSYVQDEQKDAAETSARISSVAPANEAKIEQQGSLHITARMGGLEILTRSPSDDSVLLRFAAITSELSYKSSEEEAAADVKLNNLIIEDQRMLSLRPDFRYILSQGTLDGGVQDMFLVSYKKRGSSMDVAVNLGSPEIVLPSDVLVDVLEFWGALFPSVSAEEVNENAQPSTEMLHVPTIPSDVSASEFYNKADSSPDNHLETTVPDSDMTVQIASGSTCKVILVDVGGISSGAGGAIGGTISQSQTNRSRRLSDCVVIQGGVAVAIKMTGGSHVSSDYELTWSDMQAFTARGSEFQQPIQMLDPSLLSAVYRTSMREDFDETEIKLWSLKSVDFTVSMEDLALLLAILSSFGDALAAGPSGDRSGLESSTEEDDTDKKVVATKELTAKEAERINRLSLALTEAVAVEFTDLDGDEDRVVSGSNKATDETHGREPNRTTIATVVNTQRRASSMKLKVAFPETTLTIINDLNGLDEGLFKLFVSDFLVSGEIQYPSWLQRQTTSSVPLLLDSDVIKPALKFEMNQILTAKYFDTHSSMWEPLLLQPFETNFSALRAPDHNHPDSERLQSTINIELDPCHISFSEKFLVSLGAASRMWSSYSFATSEAAVIESSALESTKATCTSMAARAPSTNVKEDRRAQRNSSLLVRKSTAANAARSFVTSLPYRVENHSGMVAYFDLKGEKETRRCESGTNEYFRFEPTKGKGVGGRRTYGQDVTEFHKLTLRIGDRSMQFGHLDAYLNMPTQTHELGSGRQLFTRVIRKGRSTCLVLSSSLSIYNCTSSLDFRVSFRRNGDTSNVGIAERDANSSGNCEVSELSNALGVPIPLLSNYDGDKVPSIEMDLESRPETRDVMSLENSNSVILSPILGEATELVGVFSLPSPVALIEMGEGVAKASEIICQSSGEKIGSAKAFTVRLVYHVTMVGGHPLLSICLHPRAIIENKVPLQIVVKTPQSFTFSPILLTAEEDQKGEGDGKDGIGEVIHTIAPFGEVEIYSPDAHLAASIKIEERPVAGNETGWSRETLELPLDSRIHTPLQTILPFISKDDEPSPLLSHTTSGDHLFVIEKTQIDEFTAVEDEATAAITVDKSQPAATVVRRMVILAMNFAIDHTQGDLLLEEVPPQEGRKGSAVASSDDTSGISVATRGAYALPNRKARLILIPSPDTPFKLVPSKLKPPGADSFQLGSTFRVKDVIFCGGGVQSSAILWDKSKIVSSYFAYRKFSSFGQTEIHLVPEFVVFNGSGSLIHVAEKVRGDITVTMKADEVVPWIMPDRARGLNLIFKFPSIGGKTDDAIRFDEIGSKVLVVRNRSGGAIGSISVQTEPGHSDSRLVIKVGALKLSGADDNIARNEIKSEQLFTGDFFRFRARLAELQITLNDTQQSESMRGSIYDRNRAALESAFDIKAPDGEAVETGQERSNYTTDVRESNVAQIIFERFTVDFQRIFKARSKDTDGNTEVPGIGSIDDADALERSQLAVIISVFQIKDCTPDARYPVIFDSSDTSASFLDLCIRLRGSFDQPLVHLECFDLNISCVGGKANTITIKTDERFLWKMLVSTLGAATDDFLFASV